MAGRLSFSIAINLITENFKKGANQVQSMFSKLKNSVLGFAAVLGVGGASLRSFIETTSGFEAAVSKLSAILGTTPDKIKNLTDSAKKLGETTKYTAAEATNLQTELAKLGFTKNEILSATESVLRFAQATDAGLAEAAALAGAALRMFGAEATESKRYVSAMSVATTKSALSFAYLRDALPTVGPVAKAFNFEIEDTLALLGKLSDSGFDASSAATATRNILLNLADSGGKLATALGGPVKTLPELVSGLQKLKEKGVDLNTTLQLTDKRSVAAFNAFLQSADKITSLRDAITGVEGDLDQMASTMGDNVKGAMAGLASAWEAILIKMSEGTNEPLKNLIKWITDLLRNIKSGFAGTVAFVITLISGKLLQSIVAFFSKHWALIDTTINKSKVAEEQKLLASQRRIEAEKALEAELTAFETVENGKRLGSKQKIKKAEIALSKATSAEKRAILAAETSATQAAALKSATVWGKMGKTITLAFASAFNTIKALFSTIWVTALITAVGTLIGKFVNMYTEAKRIKKIFSDYKAEADRVGNTQEVTMLKVQLSIMNDKKKSQEEINNAQTQLQKMLNVENKSQKELNDLVAKRVKLLEGTAKAQYYTDKKIEAQDRYNELNRKHSELKAQTIHGGFFSRLWNGTEVGDMKKEMNELLRIISDSSKEINAATVEVNKLSNTGNTTIEPDNDTTKTDLQKAEEQYARSLRELDAKKEIGLLKETEYYKSVDELAKRMLVEAKASEDREILTSDYIKMLEDVLVNPLYTGSMKAQDELAKVESEYQKSVSLAKAKLDKKLLTEDDYRKALVDAAIAAANSAISIENIGSAADKFIMEMQGVVGTNLKIETPKLGKRDATFDYKKSKSDKLSEEVDIWVKYRDDLKDKLEEAKKAGSDTAKSLEIEFSNALAKVGNMEDALKLAQVQEDIKNLNKELSQSLYSGVKDIASSSDRIVSAFSNLRDVMNDVNASGWERIMAIWNAMTNVVDTFLSISKMIENITDLTNKLCKAKEAEAMMDTATTATKVTNAATGAAASLGAAAIEKTAATGEVAANTAKGVSAAGASAAKLPFPANIIAIGTAIAAAVALFATIPKFAKGGIIGGGPSSGDKILARVNAGEMILNQGQQSRLFAAINSGKLGGSGGNLSSTVSTRVRAKDIILTINNELKSQGKKPIS